MVTERAAGGADDLHAEHVRACEVLLVGAGVDRRARDLAKERPEAAAQAAAVVDEAAQDIGQAPRLGEAAAKADRTQAPAAAEPKARMLAVLLERLPAEQRGSDIGGQQPLEDRRRLLLPLVAVDLPADDLVGQTERERDGRELVGQIRLVRARERVHESREVLALLVGRRAVARRVAQRLANAQPVPPKVVVERAERARPAADQPAEDDAAANVAQAPGPLLHRPQLVQGLGRHQTQRDLVRDEPLEDPVCKRELVLAARRALERVLLQPFGVPGPLKLLGENRLIAGKQLP